MLKKIFTVSGGECPNGLGHKIDSPNCRKCRYYFRQGTGTFFFWCNFPQKQEENSPKPEEKPKRRGRPRTKKTPPKVESIFGKKRKRRTIKKK